MNRITLSQNWLLLLILVSLSPIVSAINPETHKTTKTYCANDTIPPVITLNGSDTMCIEVTLTFVDPGATAYDSCDGDVTSSLLVFGANIDTRYLGTHYLKYVAADSDGNISDTVTRVIYVVSDNTPPIITLSNRDTAYVQVDSSFTPSSFTALDETYGDLTNRVQVTNAVNTSVLGEYQVTYYVETPPNKCSTNNSVTLIRTVYVIDTIHPVISALDGSSIVLEKDSVYTYSDHIVLSDNHCSQEFLWDSLNIIQNDVNVNAKGSYSTVFQTKDSAGNLSNTFTLNVEVKDLVSVQELTSGAGMLYPNPTTSSFAIKKNFASISTITVTDLQGRVVKNLVPNETNKYNIKDLPEGVYLISFVEDGKSYQSRIVKL